MIATYLAIPALMSAPVAHSTPDLTASQLVSRMLAKYAAAKTLVGKVQMKQSMAGYSVSITTEIQYDREGRKLYIRQIRSSAEPKTWLVTCNGKLITYDTPTQGVARGQRLAENAKNRDLGELYALAGLSLGDVSAPLDICFGKQQHLQYLNGQWVTVDYLNNTADKAIKVIGGDWREYQRAVPTGKYEFHIAGDGELKGYVLREQMKLEGLGVQTVTTSWSCDLKVNVPVDSKLFTPKL